MNILFLRGFNNYQKRTIIKFSTLQDYQDNSASFLNYSGINFNPNDGVVTELVVGSTGQLEDNAFLKFDTMGNPDYCVCYEMDEEQQVTIVSRWFILESVRLTAGQYRMALKRDAIADKRDWILNADCFIEKGQIMDEYSPFIFNNESMTYNQIKKKEIPLYDSTGCAWIVGYCAKNSSENGNQCIGKITNGEANGPDSAYDFEDLPFGTLNSTQLLQGITFNTMNAVNVLWKAVYQSSLAAHSYYHCGRARILFNNGSMSSVDTDYGQRFRSNVPTGPAIDWKFDQFGGDGLGEYYGEEGFFLDTSLFPNNCSKRGGDSMAFSASTSQITNYFMNRMYSGRTIASNIVNETMSDGIGYDFSGSSYIQGLKGKILRVSDGLGGYIYYTINVVARDIIPNVYTPSINGTTKAAILEELNNSLNSYNAGGSSYYEGKHNIADVDTKPLLFGDVTLACDMQSFDITFTQMPATIETKTFFAQDSSRWGTNDQLFDIFCIPYGDNFICDDNVGGVDITVVCRKDAALAAARSFATYLGSKLYDLQILPYCPIKEVRNMCSVQYGAVYTGADGLSNPEYSGLTYSPRNYNLSSHVKITDPSIQTYRIYDNTDTSKIYGYVFWCTESHGTIDIPVASFDNCYYQYSNVVPTKVLKKKISNETELFRLCSPNYNGLFEYSPAKNNDTDQRMGLASHPNPILALLPDGTTTALAGYTVPKIVYMNVDYTYRPGNPYIHINPIFKDEVDGGFYGKDWNDSRGLICQGDFSLGYIIDAFREYQIQNANFQNIFNRQIQNLDVSNAIAYEQTKFSGILGAIGMPVGGATTGGLIGAKAGGVYGAIAGAAVGGVGGLAGGIYGYQKNIDWLERSQEETRSYMKDMYTYQLGNIKALPYSISKTDCLTENSRLVPFLEVYQASEKEVTNLLKVIKYNGMTVMTISKPREFLGSEVADADTEQYSVTAHNKACYYIKGKLIMNVDEEFNDDFHMLDAIYAELDKGVYLQGYEVVEEEEEEEV